MVCSIVAITVFQNKTDVSNDFCDAHVLILVKFTTNWRDNGTMKSDKKF